MVCLELKHRRLAAGHVKAEEFEVEPGQGVLDYGQGEAMFLNVKQEIPTAADPVKIAPIDNFRHIRIAAPRRIHDVAAAPADVDKRRCVCFPGDHLADHHNGLARGLAVKGDKHQAAGTQQIHQNPPAGQRIVHVMQHSGAFDEIEPPPQALQLEDVALAVFDIADAEFLGLAQGIGEAGAA